MSQQLFNENRIRKEIKWLMEQVKCLTKNQVIPVTVDQDNILVPLYLVITGDINYQIVADAINTLPSFTVNDKEILVIIVSRLITQPTPKLLTYKYLVSGKGKGTYGQGGTPITLNDLILIYEQFATGTDISLQETTQIINLGDVGGNISSFVNGYTPLLDIQEQSEGYVLFRTTEGDYLFLAEGGLYGLGGLQTTQDDFVKLSGENEVGDFIPLAGTEVNKPITGDLEITGTQDSDKRIYNTEFGRTRMLYFSDDGILNLSTFNVSTNSTLQVGVDRASISVTDNIGGYTTTIELENGVLKIQSTDPDFKGAQYLNDYSDNYDDRSLIDKEYSDRVYEEFTLQNEQNIDSPIPSSYYADNIFNTAEGYTLNRHDFTSKKYVSRVLLSANSTATLTFCIGSLDQNDIFVVRKELSFPIINGLNDLSFDEFLDPYEEVALKFPFNFVNGNVGSYNETPGKQYTTGLGYNEPLLLQTNAMLAMQLVTFDVIENPLAFNIDLQNLEYRVEILENRGLIVTAPNGEQSEVTRNNAGNLVVSTKEFNNILHLGNSILRHPITSYWWGDWGMAASIRENDYAHKFLDKVKVGSPSAISDELNISQWEVNPSGWDKTTLDPYLIDKDLIVIRLGENVSDFPTYQTEYKNLIQYIQTQNPTAKIVIGGQFWVSPSKETKMLNVANELGLTYVKLDQLDIPENKSFIGAIVKGDDGLDHVIDNSGVAIHPNDLGMSRIADLLYSAISGDGKIIPFLDEVIQLLSGKANLAGGNNFTGEQVSNGNFIVIGEGDPNQVNVNVKNTKTIGDAQFNAINSSDRTGKLFKAGPAYGVYKILGPNDLGFYNDTLGGNIAILNDTPLGSVKVTAGGKIISDIFIAPSGNIGIGNNENPTELLDVKGKGKFTGTVSGAEGVNNNDFVTKSQLDTTLIPVDYGTSVNITKSAQVFTTGSGTGPTTINLLGSVPIGSIVFVSDWGNDAADNIITVDVGAGNNILKGDGSAITQTMEINSSGLSYTLRKLTANNWMVIGTNQ